MPGGSSLLLYSIHPRSRDARIFRRQMLSRREDGEELQFRLESSLLGWDKALNGDRLIGVVCFPDNFSLFKWRFQNLDIVLKKTGGGRDSRCQCSSVLTGDPVIIYLVILIGGRW